MVLKSTHNLCFEQKYEKYQSFLSENFLFLEVKISIYLNRCLRNCAFGVICGGHRRGKTAYVSAQSYQGLRTMLRDSPGSFKEVTISPLV